jgi:prolyl oligopeptidase
LKIKIFFLALNLTILNSCTTKLSKEFQDPQNSFEWLEEIESPKALEFAKSESDKTVTTLKADPNYKKIEKELRKVAYAEDRIPWSYPMKGKYYNFWQDKINAKGIWRRTTLFEYKKNKPKWENLIDLDKLSKDEKENWVWRGASCLPPDYELCLISLSRGGKDAKVVREYDLNKKEFVKNGFFLPEAKTSAAWIDRNSLYVGTEYGPESLTISGYARTVKKLQRGTKLSDAPIVFEINKKDQSASAYIEHTPEKLFHFFTKRYSFFQRDTFYFDLGKLSLIPMPKDADFYGYFKGYLLYSLKSEIKKEKNTFKTGSLVALPLDKIKDDTLSTLELVWEPTDKISFQNLSTTKNHILIEISDNIKGKIIHVSFIGKNDWKKSEIKLGTTGVVGVNSTEMENDDITLTYTDFVTPYSTYRGNAHSPIIKLDKLKSSPERFKGSMFKSEQRFAKSKDGTLIPYFIVQNKKTLTNGKNPTLLYGYGGFEVSMLPFYLGSFGKLWLEKGGVYVLANIRGGSEYGPNWHKAALRENRQIVFDDFIAIAEDLIKTNVTSSKHLGIQGGSNGGLLVAGTFIQRPELFNAVICEVPLLDMLKYHTLLAGSSWMEEYGNPDDPKMREIISKYSPYQNVKANITYPEVFFSRVQKMIASIRPMQEKWSLK